MKNSQIILKTTLKGMTNVKDGSYEVLKKAAEYSLDKYAKSDVTDAKSVIAAVKASKKLIDEAFRQAKKNMFYETSGDNFLKHIYDNKYLYDEKHNELESALKSLSNLPGCKGSIHITKKEIFPYYFMCFYSYLEAIPKISGWEFITAFAEKAGENHSFQPTISDFFNFGTLFKACVFTRIGSLCASRHNDNEKTDTCEEIVSMTNALRQLCEYPFDRYFEKSKAEEYLKKDPSGYYCKMTEETKNIYRSRLVALAWENGVSETEYAADILKKATDATDKRKKHIGFYLYPELCKTRQTLYFVSLFSSTAIITALLAAIHPLNLLALFPLWELCSQICARLFSSFTTSYPLPSLEIEKLPDNGGVLTVITAIPNQKLLDSLFTRLENMYLSTRLDNTYFALLCDFPESSVENSQNDRQLFSLLCDRTEALNFKYKNKFFLFVRNKVFNSNEEKFMGYERKRGAVNQLCSYLSNPSECPFMPNKSLPGAGVCDRIRYILTLDSDTEIPPDSIKKLAGIMLHPLNTPVTDKTKGIVTNGYGLLQPGVASCLSSWRKTAFTGIMGASGGFEIYSFAGFELYQSIFGEGSFCGKGFFDKQAFSECLVNQENGFPENMILSHDLPEGAKLHAANVTNLNFLDRFPSDSVSYLKRLHRWVRGDTQNLYFLKKHIKNTNGELIKNNISALSKFKLFDGFRRDIVPVFSYICIILSLFLPSKFAALTALFSIFYILLGFIWQLSFAVSDISIKCAARKYFSKNALPGIFTSMFRVSFEVSMLPCVAAVSADAVFRSLYRMFFSKKKMLEWTTSHDSEQLNKNNLLYYIRKNLFCAVSGTTIYVFSTSGLLKLIGLMWFLFPICSYLSGKPVKSKENVPTLKQYEKVKEYAEKTWNYFNDAVSEKSSFLPVDNIQLYPSPKISQLTSPTNIGLYMASALAARDFGFINTNELYSRLHSTLETVEGLKKWNGHLYNWYNTNDGSVIPPNVVSSVDSGNFLACLVCLKEGLKEYVYQNTGLVDIIGKIENIINNTDISKLYDKRKKLFYISAEIKEDKNITYSSGHFDMLMSEARILSYIAVARKECGPEHYARLSRPAVKHSDRVGFASWTGTAFEYFMPALFMPVVKGSLMYEALRFALYRQKSRCARTANGKIFGMSESGYHSFDKNMNYQYKAFGIPELAYKSGLENELVISPYSSFLMMPMDIKSTLDNLEKLKKEKLYGPYGFYESYDFTPSRCPEQKIVKSNMAHHSGMSLIACANTVFDNCFVRRFMNDAHMRSFGILLEERIPFDAVIRNLDRSENTPSKTR